MSHNVQHRFPTCVRIQNAKNEIFKMTMKNKLKNYFKQQDDKICGGF